MKQTRCLCWLGCLFLSTPTLLAADDLLVREGRHIRLTTDLAQAAQADSLVASFDAAVPQWAKFWNLSNDALAGWKVDAYVIRSKATFTRQGLIPASVPDFPFGYALGNQVFVLAQQSEYYTRHLLLHEGVHSLAMSQFGGTGPTWFREGTAELLGTHSGSGATTQINHVPENRDDVPYWGRFKLMKQLREQEVIPTFDRVLRYKPDLRGDVESYGWSWAAVMLLSRYPDYRDAFQEAARRSRDEGPRFNRQLMQNLQSDWPVIAARWRLMTHDLDYGFDWSREQVALSVNDPLWDGKPIEFEVAPDQGWQSIGVRIRAKTKVRLAATGEITLADAPKPWLSQPPGITFQYHRSRPLGQLLVAVVPNAVDPQATKLKPLEVHSLDRQRVIPAASFSWLVFRVNDRPNELDDNKGNYRVKIEVDRS